MSEESKQRGKSNGHSSDSSGSKKVILENSDKAVVKKVDPAWFIGAKRAFKPFYWLAGLIVIWRVIAMFQLINPNIIASGTLLLSALMFVISIPMGIFLRMDVLATNYASNIAPESALILALPIVLLNFILIGAYRGWRSSFKAKKPDA